MGGTLPIDSRLSIVRKVVLKEHLSRSERQRWRHVNAKKNFSVFCPGGSRIHRRLSLPRKDGQSGRDPFRALFASIQENAAERWITRSKRVV
jgi:hypothetical protein